MLVRKYFSLCLFFLLILNAGVLSGQQAGRVYEFLNLSPTARITALGGHGVPFDDHDLGMALVYPSLLNPDMTGHLSLNVVDYFDDINYGTLAFARHFPRLGSFSASIQYIDYGRFTLADETGHTGGEFTAGEYSLQLGWGRMLNESFSLGSNLKLIYSAFDIYRSLGLAVDVSLGYVHEEQQLSAALVARHMGRQLTYYHNGNRESLPFDLVFGISKKLANAPFRFSLVANNLHRPDLTYEPPLGHNQFFESQGGIQESDDWLGSLADKTMRHLVFGVEFIPLENFSFRAGYNYRRRQEMKVASRLSTVGFSWGFGIRISRFHLNYGRSNYHLAGAPNHLSISTSLPDLFQGSNDRQTQTQ